MVIDMKDSLIKTTSMGRESTTLSMEITMMDSSVKEFSMGLASIALWEEVITKARGVMALKKELDY
jgi:hypothetical protein